jgi:hypothetical protein
MPASGSSSSNRLGEVASARPDLEPPLLAVGKVRHRGVGARLEIDQRQRVLDLRVEAGNALQRLEQIEPELAAQLRQRRDGQVLAHGQAVEQLVDLVALGQPELADVGHGLAGDVLPSNRSARGRRHLAGQHLEEGGLAGAVRADDAAQFAVIDGESRCRCWRRGRRSAW